MAAAVITPPKPKGMNGCQLAGLTCQTARTMKKTMTAILTMTMTRLTRELSLMPRTRRKVRSPMMKIAGRLTIAPVATNLWSWSLQSTGAFDQRRRERDPPGPEEVVEEVGEVGRPADRDEAGGDHVLEDEVPADDPARRARRAWRSRRCRPIRRPGSWPPARRSRGPSRRRRAPAMANERMMPGPACLAASTPGRTKMPTPMMQPMPSATRSQTRRVFFRERPSSAVVGEKLAEGFRSEQAVSHLYPPVGQRYIIKEEARLARRTRQAGREDGIIPGEKSGIDPTGRRES